MQRVQKEKQIAQEFKNQINLFNFNFLFNQSVLLPTT